MHGEAALVDSYGPASVLDAGCGTGRWPSSSTAAAAPWSGSTSTRPCSTPPGPRRPDLRWVEGDLADPALDLGRTFDLVVMAGNVLIFVTPGTEGSVLANAARWLEPGGRLVAGYSLRPGGFGPAEHDACGRGGRAELEDRWSTWDRALSPELPTTPFPCTAAASENPHPFAQRSQQLSTLCMH